MVVAYAQSFKEEESSNMLEVNYTKADRACTAFTRLIDQLSELRHDLCECTQAINKAFDCDWHYIAGRIELSMLWVECMAKDASDLWVELESHVAESVAKLKTERPVDHVTWETMILDLAWRSWNLLNSQTQGTDRKQLVERFARCAESLEAFDDSEQLKARVKKDFLAGAAFAQLHSGFQLQASERSIPTKRTPSKKSRKGPDHPITVWYRENGGDYKSKREAVDDFMRSIGESPTESRRAKLYNELHNQRDRLKPNKKA